MGSTSRSQSAWTPAAELRGRRSGLTALLPGCRRRHRGQEERHRGREQPWDRVGVAAADGSLLSLDLGGDVVEPATQRVDVAAELLALVPVEVEGELHLAVAFELLELALDRGPQVGEHGGDGLDVAGRPISQRPSEAVGPFPTAGLDGVVERAGDAVPQPDELALHRGAGVIGRCGGSASRTWPTL